MYLIHDGIGKLLINCKSGLLTVFHFISIKSTPLHRVNKIKFQSVSKNIGKSVTSSYHFCRNISKKCYSYRDLIGLIIFFIPDGMKLSPLSDRTFPRK